MVLSIVRGIKVILVSGGFAGEMMHGCDVVATTDVLVMLEEPGG